MSSSQNQHVKILVVDRDREVLASVGQLLSDDGFQVQLAENAAHALTAARHRVPDLLILDTQLDGCTGFEFARVVRRENPSLDPPVIFLASQAEPGTIEAARQAGGIYCLTKPIDESVLVELVDKALWMPHLIRRHIGDTAHPAIPKPSRVLLDVAPTRSR